MTIQITSRRHSRTLRGFASINEILLSLYGTFYYIIYYAYINFMLIIGTN